VGVGTWRTRAEYKDLKVTRDGKTLFSSDFTDGTRGWRFAGGDWETENGVLRQNATGDNIRAVTGDEQWTDYTYSLKARKLGGDEGFLILFGNKPGDRVTWWNVGGWANTDEGLEIGGGSGRRTPCKIETNRWYDLRVELKGTNVKCYLDNKLVRDENIDASKPSLFASATRVNATGEVIVKVVNAAAEPITTELKLNGVASLASPAQATVLSSEKPTDENSLKEPTKVIPVSKTINTSGTSIQNEFPGNSVTVIRVKAREE
jgi:alpha-L-arabinofuranosidase